MKTCYLLLLATVALGSCKKDDSAPLRTELLIAKSWRMSADVTTDVASGKTTTTDVYARLPTCKQDDFLVFNADNSLITDEGLTKCSTTLPQALTGTWSLNDDQTKLTSHAVSYSSFILLADVVELSPTTLRLRTTTSIYPDITRTEEFTYTAF
ncbi:hypothetical protein [Hymenobacter coccineus]|uniref:Lipocalin-like domain-containing protein n=1 Tax=Hymenobacter coccineus TaxID=1908235 RepID=A0A1G1SVV0_9BACT|nr:hypothetical protein [Hymenobacter coccineus]OGX82747.1 hypothetical protein BEN49_02440 [Hymenobacter coccineus]